MILQARYIVPVESPVIENGAVTLERGRIISVGRSRGISHRGAVLSGRLGAGSDPAGPVLPLQAKGSKSLPLDSASGFSKATATKHRAASKPEEG